MSRDRVQDDSAIRWEVQEVARWRRRLALTVPPARARQEREQIVQRFTKRARLKGFRKGKAPAPLVERQFGAEIEQEVLEHLVREGYEGGVTGAGLQPIAAPKIDDVRWTAEGGLEFAAEFDVRPEIELGRTTGFRIEQTARRIDDGDVDRVLERLRHERAEWRAVERPAGTGDRVEFSSVPLDAAGEERAAERVENHRVEVGAGSVLPDFEVGLTGLGPGEEREVVVHLPDDHPDEALRGATRTFRVTVQTVSERVLAELDDAFARSLGNFDSLAETRDRIRRNLEEEVAQQGEREVHEALIDQIIEANRIELPESMVERYLDNMLSDENGPLGGRIAPERQSELRQILRPGAERALRRYSILNHLADREGLRPGEGELDAAIGERIDPAKTSVAEARRRLERGGELDDLRFHLTMERVFAWLREHSTIMPVEATDRS